MKRTLVALVICAVSSTLAQDWRSATPGWQYQFPRDHHAHPEFKTEWWYFTGNLFDDAGDRFGFELTFFRDGIVPVSQRGPDRSRFIVDDLKFAHFTITDAANAQFLFDEKASRGAFREAGFDDKDRIAWINEWSLRTRDGKEFRLNAATKEAVADLTLVAQKPPVIHGQNGVSTKATGENHASHYYSITRLTTTGTLRLYGKEFRVRGLSWFDHEWATNQLAPGQVGWNWICLQLSDGSDLMLYQMRLADGTVDVASSGTVIASDGTARHLRSTEFSAVASARWRSPKTGADYPVEWRIAVPASKLEVTVRPILREQELALEPLTYWEGAIDAAGQLGNQDVAGHGYLELTGYAGPLRELAR
jgi:Predicted secreted hydrolase